MKSTMDDTNEVDTRCFWGDAEPQLGSSELCHDMVISKAAWPPKEVGQDALEVTKP